MPEDNDQTTNPANFPTTQDELNRIIQNALAPKLQKIQSLELEKNQAQQDRDAAQAKVTERDGQIQNLEGKVTTLESTVGEKDRTILVNQVAHSKGVPAKYLSGDSQEALAASADEFLTDVRSLSGSTRQQGSEGDKGEGQGSGQSNNGYVPSAGTGDEKPPRPTYDERKQAAYEAAKNQKGSLL